MVLCSRCVSTYLFILLYSVYISILCCTLIVVVCVLLYTKCRFVCVVLYTGCRCMLRVVHWV